MGASGSSVQQIQATPRSAPSRPLRRSAPGSLDLLALQRTAGNRATSQLLQRQRKTQPDSDPAARDDAPPPGAVQDPNDPSIFHVETYETLKVAGRRAKARRSDDQGPVRITLQKVPTRLGAMYRPIRVEGKIVPTVTTGRNQAPDALSGIKTGTKAETLEDRESIMDAHRGHLMALELGGPDLPVNIVPQWAMFQANGVWRQAEVAALAAAEEAAGRGFDCLFVLEVQYLENASGQLPSRRRLGTPKGFTMKTQNVARADGAKEDEVVHFDGEQDRDERDWANLDAILTGRKPKKPKQTKKKATRSPAGRRGGGGRSNAAASASAPAAAPSTDTIAGRTRGRAPTTAAGSVT